MSNITHDSIREIAKSRLHWSGGRVEVLRYCDEQEAKEERAKKVEELLRLYQSLYHHQSDDWFVTRGRIKQLEEELK